MRLFAESRCDHGNTGPCSQRRWRGRYGAFEDCPGGSRIEVTEDSIPLGVYDEVEGALIDVVGAHWPEINLGSVAVRVFLVALLDEGPDPGGVNG